MSPPPGLDELTTTQLKELVVRLLDEVAALKRTNVELREEVARLKGLKGRPDIKPSGMEKATEPAKPGSQERRRRRGKVQPRVNVEDRVLKVAAPAGSRFKGYETYLVQELVLSVQAIRYRRERWVTPDGRTMIAPLPEGTEGHFGPDLRRFVLMQYHQGQTTLPRLTALLQSVGLSISKREVERLLIEKHDDFLGEARDVLRAGLQTSPWISVDDTGARHKVANGFCTQIGNDRFTWFGTRPSKSRLNFLDLLRAGHTDFVLNPAAFDYMRSRALSAPLIARLAEQPETVFADRAAWLAHLDRLGFTGLTITPEPIQIATEGAIWGSIHAHDFLRDAVVLSDDAGQFAIGRHALCWVHAERLVHKLDAFTDHNRAAQQRVRKLIWNFYAALKAYRASPKENRRLALQARFDRIFRLSHRLRHTRSPAGALVRQQSRAADGARPARDTIEYQWLRERHPMPCYPPQGQRWNAQRPWPRLPRCVPRPYQNLHQARRGVLGLSRQPSRSARPACRAAAARPGPLPRATCLIPAAARGFAPITYSPCLRPIRGTPRNAGTAIRARSAPLMGR